MSERRIGDLVLGGGIPRVVAAINNVGLIADFGALPVDTFDVAEVRLHPDARENGDWKAGVRLLHERGIPTLLTLRISSEGGSWLDDANRAEVFRASIADVAAIDVEMGSASLSDLVFAAHEHKRIAIGSFHDFAATPSLDVMRRLADGAEKKHVDVLKIAAMVNSTEDVWTLLGFLDEMRKRMPVCIIGMGAAGLASRYLFPALGSCLTYGFLDASTAPGQVSCARMMEFLRETMPGYAENKEGRVNQAR